ncbi:putative leucine-rich repeat-containing, plant-type, leucine-rich repeat domain superfamily [Dioscorea sansibarensis]
MKTTTTTLTLHLPFLFFFFLSISFPTPSFSQSSTYPIPLNPRLDKAYIALQAFKHSITSDPKNFTGDWCGPHVCNYTAVYCAPALDDPDIYTVAGIDLNHANISGELPEDLGLLTDLALFHLNSNQFCGTLPESFSDLKLLYELDVSNNLLSGPFPSVVLKLPSLKYLDLRYNSFDGDVPKDVFNLNLDAFFINNNNFTFTLPANIGHSPVSVLVVASNQLNGCLPLSIANMSKTLNEIIIQNSNLSSCIPPEYGQLVNLTVFDVAFNNLVGPLPETFGKLKKLEQLDVAHNKLSGDIPESICELPRLKNFTFSYNYFCGEPDKCSRIRRRDDRENCIPYRPDQRSEEECSAFLEKPVHCDAFGCMAPPPPPPTPPPTPPPEE